MIPTVTLAGDKPLFRLLQRLSGPEMVRVGRSAARMALKPVVKDAQANVPVVSGRLHDSLGIEMSRVSRRGTMVARVKPRRTFKNTTSAVYGMNRKPIGEVKSYNIRGKVAKGASKDARAAARKQGRRDHPITYARFIELGVTRSGSRRRRAGAALFLTKAWNGRKFAIVRSIGAHLRAAVHKIRKDLPIPPLPIEE
jgi:hypothetical protein